MKRTANILYAMLHPVILLPVFVLWLHARIERWTVPAQYVEPEGKWWKE